MLRENSIPLMVLRISKGSFNRKFNKRKARSHDTPSDARQKKTETTDEA